MTQPRILIIDDQLSANLDQRSNFCFKCSLKDIESENSDAATTEEGGEYLADAYFCSGEKDGKASHEVIEEAVRAGWENSGPCPWSLVLLDVSFGKYTSFGLEARTRLAARLPDLPIVMLTASTQSELDNYDAPYLSKMELNMHGLKVKLIKHGCLTKGQIERLLQLEQQHVIAASQALKEVFLQALVLAGGDTSILILGETGVGKELVAKYIHNSSPRRHAVFIGRNVAEIHKEQMAAELFGIEKHAATGVSERVGIFQQAHKGTLFLDEIGDMPQDAQVAVLRTLQERKVMRVGGHQDIHIDIRLLTATSRDLQQLMAEGQFRNDVYFRIAQAILEIPPLRERREDIRPLAEYFLDSFQRALNRTGIVFSKDAIRLLEDQSFRGNVRQLRNVVERLTVYKGNNELINGNEVLAEIRREERKAPRPYAAARTLPRPDTALKQPTDFVDLEALLLNAQVPTSLGQLSGKLSALQTAYGQLVRKLLENALRETKVTYGKENVLPAIKLLLGEGEVRSTSQAYDVLLALARTFPSSLPLPIPGLDASSEVDAALLKALKNRRPVQKKNLTEGD